MTIYFNVAKIVKKKKTNTPIYRWQCSKSNSTKKNSAYDVKNS